MQIISFAFIGLTVAVFCFLYANEKLFGNKPFCAAASKWILLAASYGAVIYIDWRYAAVLAAVTLAAWYCARNIRCAAFGVAASALALAYFKYTNFMSESVARLFGCSPAFFNIMLPVGLSFYTFSAISYIVDVKRGKTAAAPLSDVALYLAFFPKFVSGPIQRSGDFFAQLNGERKIGWESFSTGVQIFAFGMFKKLVLADRLSVFVNQVYETPGIFDSKTVLLAAAAYSFQIYFDFSGYSDMAIGAARVLGFKLPRNFNLPYLSHNVTELWKRWHITLSSWLQEYLYIPLGGSRKGKVRTYINLILTMVIGGLWHGANATFIIWGLLHGVALAVHKLFMQLTKGKKSNVVLNALSVLLTFAFVTFTWIFFRAESLSKAAAIIKAIFAFKPGVFQPYFWLFVTLVIYFVCACAALARSPKQAAKPNFSRAEGFYPCVNLASYTGMTLFFVFCGLILCLAYTGGSPFIYGNF